MRSVLSYFPDATKDYSSFYEQLTHHYVAGPQSLSYFISIIILPIALLIPPSILSHKALRLLFLPPFYGTIVHAWLAIGGLDVISMTIALWGSALLGFRDGRRFVRIRQKHSNDESHKDQHGAITGMTKQNPEKNDVGFLEESYPDAFLARVRWVLALLVSLRLVGWKIGEKTHDKKQSPQRMSRIAFAQQAISIVALDYLLLDATFLYVKHDPYFTISGIGIDEPFSYQERVPDSVATLQLLPPRPLRSTILAAQVFAMVSGMFYLPVLPASALNAAGILPDEWSPHTWPSFFGNFSAISNRGLRGLWGSWWHQINREFVSTPGSFLIGALSLPRKSLTGYTILVVTSFFFSGVLHTGLIPPKPFSTQMTANEMRLYIALFFWFQVAAITVEGLVERLARQWRPFSMNGWPNRLLVLLWTACWLCICLPLLTDPFREIGYWRHSPIGNGLLQPLHNFIFN